MGHSWHMKTPVKTGPEFQPGIVWNSGCTPGEFRRNYCRHSAGIVAVFQTIPPGIPADLPPAFPKFRRNYCQHPPVFHQNCELEFGRNYCRIPWYYTGIPGWNYCRHFLSIPSELSPTFSWYSTGILAELLLAFRQQIK